MHSGSVCSTCEDECVRADDVTISGAAGWRAAFLCVAALSAIVGALTLRFARDPSAQAVRKPAQLGSVLEHLRGFLRVPSFVIIVLQVRPPLMAACGPCAAGWTAVF